MVLNNLDKYGPIFQSKVISSLLTNKKFLNNIYDVLSDEYFNSQANKWIIKEILKYYQEYHTTPSMEVLKIELEKIENEILKISIKEKLQEAYSLTEETDLEYVKEEFSNFCKNQKIKEALLKSTDILKTGDYESIRHLLLEALRAGQEKDIGLEYNEDIESRYREDARNTVPTPWEEINSLLQGGLGDGDIGLIYGGPGAGKTWVLLALTSMALKLGYNVIYYTLELGESYLGLRADAVSCKIPFDKIKNHLEEVKTLVKQLPGKLLIKEYSPHRASVLTLESHVKRCQENGFNADLLVIDYADYLRPEVNRRDNRKGEIDDIYIGVKGLAKELKLPIWTATQVNRQGAEDDIIEGNKVAGSYDKNAVIDFGLSLSRKRKDKTKGTGRFLVIKNRYGEDGKAYNLDVDTSIGKFLITSEFDEEEKEDIEKINKVKSITSDLEPWQKRILKNEFFKLQD